MLQHTKAFSGFSVDDLDRAEAFYGETLGLPVERNEMGMLTLGVGGGEGILIYPKDDHVPATFTILNFPVDDTEAAVDALTAKGVEFLRYDGTDDKGIQRGYGPVIAWFTDPAGNVLSVLS